MSPDYDFADLHDYTGSNYCCLEHYWKRRGAHQSYPYCTAIKLRQAQSPRSASLQHHGSWPGASGNGPL